MTKNYNPAILRLTAVFAILLSFIAKFWNYNKNNSTICNGRNKLNILFMIAIVGFKTIKKRKS